MCVINNLLKTEGTRRYQKASEENMFIGLLKFIEIENYLGDLLGVKVDLVEKSALKPRIGRHILKEVVYA